MEGKRDYGVMNLVEHSDYLMRFLLWEWDEGQFMFLHVESAAYPDELITRGELSFF